MAMGLKLLLVFSALIATTRQGGPECSSTTLVTSSDAAILIDTSGTPCVRCVDNNGAGSRHTLYVIEGFMPMSSQDEIFPPGFYVGYDGVLMILDADSLIPAGSSSPLLLDCLDKPFLYTRVRLFSYNLVPPTVSPSSLNVTEGSNASAVCNNSNSELLVMMLVWLDPMGSPIMEALDSPVLTIANINRTQAGVYQCLLAVKDGQQASANVTIFVESIDAADPEPVENIEQQNNCSGGNGTSLYFMLGDTRYESGSTLFITDVGASFARTGYSNPDASLVCMTENVNTQCCRQRDQGNMGEWYFPDGSRVPRNRNHRYGDFSRNGYHQQVRLNRRNDAVWPTGAYTCSVPEEGNLGCIHTASINIIVPPPREVMSFCMITVWKPPPGPFDLYSGYDVRYSHPKFGDIIFERENDEFFFFSDLKMDDTVIPNNIVVQVRTKIGDDYSPWTEPAVPLCPHPPV